MGSNVGSLLQTAGSILAAATGNPELVPLIQGGGDLVRGKGFGSALKDAALSFGGQELGGALGNQFPETFGGTFGTGGNSLTDLIGSTSGAGSLTGAGTIGGDISNLFSGTSGTGGIGSFLSGGSGSPTLSGGTGKDTLGGLNSGSYYTPGSISAPLNVTGGGGASSFGSSGDITSQFANGLTKGTGYTPPVGIAGLSAAPASSGGLGQYLLPALGAASSLGSNLAAQGQLSSATNKANAQLNPYLKTGAGASSTLGGYLGLPGGQGGSAQDILAASPGYQFQLDQGNRALAAQHAASGSLNSGAAMKAAEQFGTGLANQTGQQYFSNLQGTAGQGLGAAGQYGNNTTALGSAKGAASIATGNTLAQLLSGTGGRRVVGYNPDGSPKYGV